MTAATATVLCALAVLVAAPLLGWVVRSARAETRRVHDADAAFVAAARADGWSVVAPTVAAKVLGTLVTWKPARLVMTRPNDAGDLWFTWHYWVTYSSNGRVTMAERHHRGRYYTRLPVASPARLIAVQRRSTLGATLKAVRGIGTGDAEFDRRFMVKPVNDPGGAALATPLVRAALMSGTIPPFSVYGGFAMITFEDRPREQTLAERTQAIVTLASLLR
jgi:hypothetical protein